MDEADVRILAALEENARLSWVALSQIVNLSPSACQRRVEAMQADGLIEGFTLRVNARKRGLTVHAFIQIKVERQAVERAKALRAKIASYPEVKGAWKLSGQIDYLVEVQVADITAFSQFIDENLLSLDGVVDASSSIVLGEVA